jgi:hypothetical protein
MAPCTEWIDAADVAQCCGEELSTENEDAYEAAARIGELVAWEVSGRRFSGECGPIIVRPCGDECGCWTGVQWLAYPDGTARPLWTGTEWHFAGRRHCGCSCLSQVRLAGFVREIVEVKIDGVVIDPGDYRVDKRKYLVRKNNGFWPSCQNQSLDDDEPGTFSVEYTYGVDPNEAALEAAKALACEYFHACAADGDCRLPQGAVKIIRQGVTIERLQPLASMLRRGETGILEWDTFVELYGRHRRKPHFLAPGGMKRHAPKLGLPGP